MTNNHKSQPAPESPLPPEQLTIELPKELETGIYANAWSLNFTPNEVLVDFGLLLPHPTEKRVKVLSRIILSHAQFRALIQSGMNTLMQPPQEQPPAPIPQNQ